jgi:uncharacterized protein
MATLSVSAHDIDIAGLSVEAELPPAWLEEHLAETDLLGAAPGHVSVRLSRSGNDIVVRGRIRAELTTPCARCLNPAPVHVDAELSLLLKPATGEAKKANGPAHKEVEYEFASEEADQDTYDGETAVLDPFLREAILLEVPNFPLCSEACPGIRPAPSAPMAEPALDPRLAPLEALRAKLAPEKKKE